MSSCKSAEDVIKFSLKVIILIVALQTIEYNVIKVNSVYLVINNKFLVL